MTRDEWIEAFATELGVAPLSADEIEALLGLAGVAAHASERTAAPLSCALVGRSSRSLEEAMTIAKRLAGST